MKVLLKKWNEFFIEKGLDPKLKRSYLKYINKLNHKDLPVIFELKHLSQILGIKYPVLSRMVEKPEKYYYKFKIPKRRGGEREICAPYPLMRYTQFWILNEILSKVTLHNNAFAYRKNTSIVHNANMHLNKSDLLKMDLKDFFNHIPRKRIIPIFQNLGYSNKVSFYLASLCCYEQTLPQGACTSPYISNIVAKRLDKNFSSCAAIYRVQYTRYADDLTFSGESIPYDFIRIVEAIVSLEGFKINYKKTQLIRGKGKKIVTGISVSGNKLKLPRSKRRNLNQEIHYIKKYGLLNHLKKRKINDAIYLERLIGKFYFWLQIEPHNKHVQDSLVFLKSIK